MPKSSHPPLITVLGPTASGKTQLAVNLCRALDGEIISADSRQVYRGMDIGTGKDLHEYGSVPYHLINIIDPQNEYNVFEFSKDFCHAFSDISSRNRLPFMVGGTGMYLDAVLQRYTLTIANKDKKARQLLEKKSERELIKVLQSFNNNLHNTTDLLDKSRLIRAIEIEQAKAWGNEVIDWPDYDALVIGILTSREQIKEKITKRLKLRLKEGMVEEVQGLVNAGVTWEKLHHFGLEYRFIADYLQGNITYNDMFQKLNSAIHYFAKQQTKWFRNIERNGTKIHWLENNEEIADSCLELIKAFAE